MATEPFRIDVHHHILPPEYVSAVTAHGVGMPGGLPLPSWDPASSLALMDRYGIATAITSISDPGVFFGDYFLARNLARRCNEFAARLVADAPRRFGAFATLPLPDTDAALLELEYALDTLHLDGVVLLSSYEGWYLGDPTFNALFTELNRRKAVVFIHPTFRQSSETLQLKLPPFLVEFVFDTTRAVVNLVYSGTLERCPDIRFVLSHAGGTIPYLVWRISLGQVFLPGLPRDVPSYLKQLYYDTALSASPSAFRSLQELVDPSHILFGSDYPFAPEPLTQATVYGIGTYDGFDDQARRMIERDGALALFPRLGTPQ